MKRFVEVICVRSEVVTQIYLGVRFKLTYYFEGPGVRLELDGEEGEYVTGRKYFVELDVAAKS